MKKANSKIIKNGCMKELNLLFSRATNFEFPAKVFSLEEMNFKDSEIHYC